MVLPLVSIIFTITYWAEKWELLKLSRVPSPYSGDLAALTGTYEFNGPLTCTNALLL